MEFYRSTLQIIGENPVLGAGTGAFPAAFSEAAEGRVVSASDNPHNEYLLIATQIGLLGLACLLWLFWQQWRTARALQDPLYRDLGSGLVLMFVVGCLFNSLLLDHAEGLLFAWLTGLIFAQPAAAAGRSAP
jgi:O-antigen ligase